MNEFVASLFDANLFIHKVADMKYGTRRPRNTCSSTTPVEANGNVIYSLMILNLLFHFGMARGSRDCWEVA